uniref:Ribosomal protein S11 n=1 Tax=Nitzschia sp. PL1-4 TaxID=2083272 RepID=A0A2Z5ZB19_9STRA|nr:ribosomal protein S11 [Nitzschia sp. PL1-4]
MRKKNNWRKGGKRTQFPKLFIYVKSTYNNTLITLTHHYKKTISWSSAGKVGFKNSKKSLPFAAQCIINKVKGYIRRVAYNKLVKVILKGQGPGREASIRSIRHKGFIITTLQDISPLSYNGCRSPKPRRI